MKIWKKIAQHRQWNDNGTCCQKLGLNNFLVGKASSVRLMMIIANQNDLANV
jgi:hypothetical protein